MHAAADRPEFAPPPQPGLAFGVVLALLAHALLMVALTWGIQWNREAQNVSAEAELWASVPQPAAPQEVVAPPPPPPPPAPVKREEVVKPPEPKPREPDINIQREKEKREKERREFAAEAERERREALARVAEDKRRKEEERVRKDKVAEANVKKLREENLKRMQGMAGGSPKASDKGVAPQASGPSASWAGRVRARVKPNIVFSDDVPGNPTAEVEVRLSPDGTIVSKRLVKASGVKSWDDAVMRALDKTEVLPRDTDGRVPTPVILEFRLRD